MKDPRRPKMRLALKGLILKELRQIRRDTRMIPLLLVAPVIQVFVFGYAATLDVATAQVVVQDRDHTAESRTLTARIGASDAFDLVGQVQTDAETEDMLKRGTAEVAVVIPKGYGKALAGDGSTQVQIVIDGSDSISASVGLSSSAGLLGRVAREVATRRLESLGSAAPAVPAQVQVRTRVLYNPELKSRIFMVPGVLAMVLMIVTMIATSMATVREKELGTMEQLIVTPVNRATLLAGKLIPFALFGLADSLVVLAVTYWWFKVPMQGSIWLLLANIFPYLLSMLGLGLLVSTISSTQQQSMMTAMFLVMMPMIYLSGFVFPIESMPRAVQPFTQLIPLRHFLDIVRGVMLKGAGFRELWPSIAKLTALGVAIFGLSVVLFRKRLD